MLTTREDLIADGDPTGGDLKEMDEKLAARLENLKDMVLYRFNGTGVVQVLSRAAELLGLVPVFPVKSVGGLIVGGPVGGGGEGKVFRDCVLVKRGSTVGDAARKIMGDVPIAYVETVGGVRVSEDDLVKVGRFDVSLPFSVLWLLSTGRLLICALDIVLQGWKSLNLETATLRFMRNFTCYV